MIDAIDAVDAVLLLAIFAATTVGLVALFLMALQRLERDHQAAAAEWRAERRELLTRIQRPDLVPIPKAGQPQAPARRDQIHEVGRVRPLRDSSVAEPGPAGATTTDDGQGA